MNRSSGRAQDFSTRSRRKFLGLTGSLLAASTFTQLAADDNSDEPLKVAVIGTGARGCDLLRSLTTIPSIRVTAICDDYAPHLSRASEYAGPQAATYSDYKKLLAEAKPDAVVIAVPLWAHFEVASTCVDAGTSVFVEKTMCYDIDQARQLAKQVDEKKCVFQVGLQRRASPIYKQAVAMVQAGLLGEITAIKAQWHRNNNWRRPVPVPKSDPHWAALEERLNWRLFKNRSRGLMAELGSHQLDVANWILGAAPTSVIASGGIDYWKDGREVHDNVFCIYDYVVPRRETAPEGNGATAADAVPLPRLPSSDIGAQPLNTYRVRVTYSSICNNAYEGASELILGTRGSLFLTTTKGLFYREKLPEDPGWLRPGDKENSAILTAGKTLKLSSSPWAHRGEPLEIDLLEADETRDELISFIDHVRRRDPRTICDVHEGLRDTAVVLMACQSLDSGAVTKYPG